MSATDLFVIAAHLGRVPLLAVLDEADRLHLASQARIRACGGDEPIFLQGEIGQELYVILEGSVRIVSSTPDGRELTLAVLGQGDFFGEMALLDGEPRSASALAVRPCTLLVLGQPQFMRVLEVAASVRKLLSFLCQRLRGTNARLQDATFLTLRQRLAGLLADLAEREGTANGGGRLLPASFNHRVLAAMLNTNRESITREAAALKSLGLLEQEGRRIRVLAPDRLVLLASGSDVTDRDQ